ncbi:MAG TPA: hypothetical protein VKI18_17575 [Albitalea sp.]|nr:hypothetical protein [Albitalea sp.]
MATSTRNRSTTATKTAAPNRARMGGVSLPATRDAGLPVGAGPSGASSSGLLGLAADASGQLDALAPTFGNILASVGLGVANSQTALDKGVIDTVNRLSATKITVVTEVIEQLNDDGLPDASQTQLITNDLSVLNFVTPTVHEWKQVALSMDMNVGAMDDETGMSFNVTRDSFSTSNFGLFLGILGVGHLSSNSDFRSASSSSHREAQWSNGSVQLDATLAPRRTTKFPVPATVTIGPQLFVSQGSVTETRVGPIVTERSVDVLISVRKASGAVNPSKSIELEAAGLLPSFASAAPFTGTTTNSDGQCKLTLRRPITAGFANPSRRTLTLRLGQLSKRFDLVI